MLSPAPWNGCALGGGGGHADRNTCRRRSFRRWTDLSRDGATANLGLFILPRPTAGVEAGVTSYRATAPPRSAGAEERHPRYSGCRWHHKKLDTCFTPAATIRRRSAISRWTTSDKPEPE